MEIVDVRVSQVVEEMVVMTNMVSWPQVQEMIGDRTVHPQGSWMFLLSCRDERQ